MWLLKVIVKLVAKLFGVDYRLAKRIGFNRHGSMDNIEYARKTFEKYIAFSPDNPAVILELGPGDSVLTAKFAHDIGARAILVDAGDFASQDAGLYRAMLGRNIAGRDDFLRQTNACYLTEGVESLRTLPSSSVDFCFSNAVLEHIRRRDLDELMRQLNRIIKPNGMMAHQIDLKDHLGGGLNNLRFCDSFWENDWVASAGFYTNRVSSDSWKTLFEDHFDVLLWEEIPFAKRPGIALSSLKNRGWNERETNVAGMFLVVKTKQTTS